LKCSLLDEKSIAFSLIVYFFILLKADAKLKSSQTLQEIKSLFIMQSKTTEAKYTHFSVNH